MWLFHPYLQLHSSVLTYSRNFPAIVLQFSYSGHKFFSPFPWHSHNFPATSFWNHWFHLLKQWSMTLSQHFASYINRFPFEPSEFLLPEPIFCHDFPSVFFHFPLHFPSIFLMTTSSLLSHSKGKFWLVWVSLSYYYYWPNFIQINSLFAITLSWDHCIFL